jgi:hypothetical protein
VMWQQLLDTIYAGQFFRRVLRDLGLSPNQVWGLTKIDDEWFAALDAALTATAGTISGTAPTPAYVHGCVCTECREHQRLRMARNPQLATRSRHRATRIALGPPAQPPIIDPRAVTRHDRPVVTASVPWTHALARGFDEWCEAQAARTSSGSLLTLTISHGLRYSTGASVATVMSR